MYILTEEKQSINIKQEVTVKSRNGRGEYVDRKRNKYGPPYVKPWKNENESFDKKWALCLNMVVPSADKKSVEISVICIAVFNTIDLANLALNSIRDAIKYDIGWDAEAYKNA